ncbi:MAG: 4'-phosphopantetheinyl transferase superfamily protein [Vicinamibacterales bacterium]
MTTAVADVNTEVHIAYWLTRELDERALERTLGLLSEDERARHARLAFAHDRRDFAAAHLLLRRRLSVHGQRQARDWRFVPGRNGKPALADHDDDRRRLSFNLSHARGLVACVVAHDVDVGIDVERVSGGVDNLDIARRHFRPSEVADVERCGGAERGARFVELWTLKEAYAKATGDGVLAGLDECAFEFEGPTSLRCELADRAPASAWKFALFMVNDYRLAVAVRDVTQRVNAFRIGNHDGDDDEGGRARLLRASGEFTGSR